MCKNVSIKFVSDNLNRSLQAAISISCNFFTVCTSKKSSWWQNCSLTQYFCLRHLNLGNNTVTCLSNQIKLTKAQKQCSVIIWLNFNRGISTILGNYSGPWLRTKKVLTIKRTKTATITQRQPKQIVEYNHRTTIEWPYYDFMMER